MGRKEKFFRAYYIQDIHLGHTFRITFRNYISIHIRITLELHQNYIRITLELLSAPPLACVYAHYNSIQKLHFQHTLDFHWACPVHSLVHSLARSFTHLFTAPLLAPTLIGVLSHYNYIQNIHQNYIHFSLDYLLRVCLFIYIIITFRNYISTYTKLTLNCPSIYLPTPLHHLLRAHHTQHYTINVCPLVCFPVRCARQAYIINIFIIYLSNCVHPPMNLTRDCARSRFTPLEGALFSKKGSAGAFYYYIYSIFRNVITK